MKLSRKFYNQKTLKIAQDLLGKFLIRRYRGKKYVGKIVETEAYCGFKDKASHASRGMTKRNKIMFGRAGHVYIYMIYGMYFCLNIVTEKEKYPAAILIRAVEPIETKKIICRGKACLASTNGPGKLCRAFKINKSLNGEDLLGDKIWIEDRGLKINRKDIVKAKRVGVDYAGKCSDYLWRFYIRGSEFVSRV
ncbi:MAG: DNA-3-methyladenine glycosylase [Parcubacteria group bacterium]|nr:DNA-3-methyladenine glycosylase [Parcubacteria group bacterium]